MYKSVIVVKNKGLLIPDDVLSKCLEKNKAFFGMAVAKDGVIEQHKMKFLKDDKALTVEDINKVQNHANYKDKQLIMAFGACDLPTEAGIQPFSLLNNDAGKSTLVMFMDGNFEEFAKTGSARSDAEFAFEDYFKNKIKKEALYRDNDLKKIMEGIKDTELTRDFAKTMLGNRGSIVFLAGNGDLHALSVKGDATQKKLSWGWTSDVLEEPKKEDPPAKKEEPKTGADAILAGLGGSTEQVELQGDARKSVLDFQKKLDNSAKPDAKPNGSAKSGGGSKSDDTVREKKTITFKVPDNLFGASEEHRLKKWLRNRLPGGALPRDYSQRRTWTIELEGAPKAAKESAAEYEKDLANLGERLEQQNKTETAPPKTSVPTSKSNQLDFGKPDKKKQGDTKATGKESEYPPKDVSPHHVGKTEDGPPAVVGMSSPIIPPAEREEMKGIIKSKDFTEAISLQGKLMEDPKQWKAYEASVPSFASQMGLESIEDTLGWTYQSMFPMTQSCPKAVLVWGHGWKHHAMKLQKLLDQANKDVDELLSKDGNKAMEQATSKKSDTKQKLDFGGPKQSRAM